MAPLQEAGKLGAVLLQFPYRCHHTPENRAHLRRLADVFGGYPLVLEIRPCLLGCDIPLEEGGQQLQEDHQPDGVGGEQGLGALAAQRGQLPAGEGAHEMDPPQEDRWRDPAGFGRGDDRRHLQGHAGIHQRHLPPRARARAAVRRAIPTMRRSPQEERAPLGRDGKRLALGRPSAVLSAVCRQGSPLVIGSGQPRAMTHARHSTEDIL
jgi:hypothetical protein